MREREREREDEVGRVAAPPAPQPDHRLLALQQSAGNAATARMVARLRAQTLAVARAGDPESLMQDHANVVGTPPMTNHHIIPENQIHDFWDALMLQPDHMVVLTTGLEQVIATGFGQLKRVAGRPNLRRRLLDVVPQHQLVWEPKLDKILDDLLAGTDPGAVADAQIPGLTPTERTDVIKRFRELIRAASGTGHVYSPGVVTASMGY
jgi:hypothetical protein